MYSIKNYSYKKKKKKMLVLLNIEIGFVKRKQKVLQRILYFLL